jgi:membrane-bound lytic murein transglycosylase B
MTAAIYPVLANVLRVTGSRRLLLLVVSALVVAAAAAACDGGGSGRAASGPAVPQPREPIPRDPAELALAHADNRVRLHAAIDRWRAAGGGTPGEVTRRALYHQRVLILLTERPRLARAVRRRLRGGHAAEVRELVAARRSLRRLTPPTRRRRFRTGPALPAGVLLRHYRRAERRFGVSRRVLAAVNLVETGFNRLRSRSTSGARGPMQFIPSTWRAYGMGGDVDEPRDAIMGAANYLRASGAPRNYRRALFAYNPSRLYVDAVVRYARRMRRERRTFYVLHSWQVFVRTPSGVRRLTGPRPR